MLSGRLLWKEGKSWFQLEQHVILYGLGLLLPSLPSREAKGIYISQWSVFLSFFDGLKLARYDASPRDL